jgi:hypothetical protein
VPQIILIIYKYGFSICAYSLAELYYIEMLDSSQSNYFVYNYKKIFFMTSRKATFLQNTKWHNKLFIDNQYAYLLFDV